MLLPLLLNLETATPVTIQEVVPYLIGYTQAPAETAIAAIYCVASVVGTGGTVSAQDPAPFTLIDRGETITITMGGTVHYVRRKGKKGLPPYLSREGWQ